MSSNLLKYNFGYIKEDEKRVIDTNELIAKKLEVLVPKREAAEDFDGGFSGGLNAEHLEGLFADGDGENAEGGEASNLIKANPEPPVPTGPDPEELLASAREEIARMQEEAMKALEQERETVLAQARETGYQEGFQKAQAEFKARQQELEQYQGALEDEYQKRIDELEPEFIETLTGIYEHIFHVELQGYRDILVYLIHSTIRKAENSRDFIVHVSQDDYPYVSMQKKQMLSGISTANITVEIIEDMLLGRNECMIETDAGIFDCSLDTELEELTKKLRLLSYERMAEDE